MMDMLNVSDIIDSSNGDMDSVWEKEIFGSLRECEKLIEKVVCRESLAILELPFYGRKVEVSLGLDEVYVPIAGEK